MNNSQFAYVIDRLVSKFPQPDHSETNDLLVSVAAAIEELYSSAERLEGAIQQKEDSLNSVNYADMLELVTELRELFVHLGEHCEEASEALWNLSDKLAVKLAHRE